jgi:hypothetical protein
VVQINSRGKRFKILTKVKFFAKDTKMGDKRIIIVPKDFHDAVEVLEGKQVRVIVDDEI